MEEEIFKGIAPKLKELKLNDVCNFDITLARGQNYYTGNVFEVYDKEQSKADFAKLKESDVINIRRIRATKIYQRSEIWEFYKDRISESGFGKIWNYRYVVW